MLNDNNIISVIIYYMLYKNSESLKLLEDYYFLGGKENVSTGKNQIIGGYVWGR